MTKIFLRAGARLLWAGARLLIVPLRTGESAAGSQETRWASLDFFSIRARAEGRN